MLGAIIGDTVGSIYEFHNTKDYDFTLFTSESGYTDDSVMTMAVARWLLADPEHTYQKLEDTMVEFAEQCPCPMGGYGTGFYFWLFHPEGLYPFDDQYGASPYESKTGRHPYGSWGNGSAMRASAVGWFFDSLEETERVAAISAAITHNHPEGIKGAQATAAAIYRRPPRPSSWPGTGKPRTRSGTISKRLTATTCTRPGNTGIPSMIGRTAARARSRRR